MKKARVHEFLKKLAGECPGVRLEWTSTVVSSTHPDVVYAKLYLESRGAVFTNKEGISAYGRSRSFDNINRGEWVHKLSHRTTLFGPVLILETFI